MIVRLHNLSARVPVPDDLRAVVDLMIECDIAESSGESVEAVEEELRNSWQTSGFNLKTDAWVIVTNKGQIVGYADLRQNEHGQFVIVLRVHPDFRGRGIGTLLLWMVEERARQLVRNVRSDLRVSLRSTLSSHNHAGRSLFEREGYAVTNRFWRIVIEMDEMPPQSFEELSLRGRLKVDVVVDAQASIGPTQLQRRTGMYVVYQYVVYEKELRAGKGEQQEEDMAEEQACPLTV
ncbi:MAG TPA: GNAT family N-acetyltransferase [Ktedonosporobacter sp.]|nr:GNAT family N-acetyltransferase [Ktedonosporobacter sp.]